MHAAPGRAGARRGAPWRAGGVSLRAQRARHGAPAGCSRETHTLRGTLTAQTLARTQTLAALALAAAKAAEASESESEGPYKPKGVTMEVPIDDEMRENMRTSISE